MRFRVRERGREHVVFARSLYGAAVWAKSVHGIPVGTEVAVVDEPEPGRIVNDPVRYVLEAEGPRRLERET